MLLNAVLARLIYHIHLYDTVTHIRVTYHKYRDTSFSESDSLSSTPSAPQPLALRMYPLALY
jgi:hypothetical protein